jgi:hypothetical protein
VRVLVLYETRRGFTLRVSHAIRDELRRLGHEASAAPIRTVDVGTVAAAHALIVGTWVQGLIIAKVGPADGALDGIAGLPNLDGRPTVVFCTCDVAPRDTLEVLAARLSHRGAHVVGGDVFRRKKSIASVPAFVERTIPVLESSLPRT